MLDPAWSQNGFMEWDSIHPDDVGVLGSWGGWNLIGYGNPYITDSPLAVFRYPWNTGTGYIKLKRQSDVGGHSPEFYVGPAFYNDQTKKRIRYEWTNEIHEKTGVREMWLRLYVDGELKYATDFAALFGAKSWVAPDASRLLSDGRTQAIISNLILDRPTPRAGYR
ncbi:hypothetical protein D3C86_1306770 [compost metagenome]